MGWQIGYDDKWSRDIGYGVPAVCDHPDCNEEIDRGLSYVCADEEPRGGDGCGLYFCSNHHSNYINDLSQCCERCRDGLEPFPAKPDLPLWTLFKLVDPSWKKWREQEGHPEPTQNMFTQLTVYYKERGWGDYDPNE